MRKQGDNIIKLSLRKGANTAVPWQLNNEITKRRKIRERKKTLFKWSQIFWDMSLKKGQPKQTVKNARYRSGQREISILTWEFDPGSGWTLAACLTHASRTSLVGRIPSGWRPALASGGRVSNAWGTCLIPGDTSRKRLLIPHKRTVWHHTVWKTPVEWDGPASD